MSVILVLFGMYNYVGRGLIIWIPSCGYLVCIIKLVVHSDYIYMSVSYFLRIIGLVVVSYLYLCAFDNLHK